MRLCGAFGNDERTEVALAHSTNSALKCMILNNRVESVLFWSYFPNNLTLVWYQRLDKEERPKKILPVLITSELSWWRQLIFSIKLINSIN